MAYKYIAGRSIASNQVWYETIRQLLLDAGWSEYDSSSGVWSVMRTQGSAADGKYIYIKITNALKSFTYYSNWNTSTDSATGGYFTSTAVNIGSPNLLWAYANIDGIAMWSSNGTTMTPANHPVCALKCTPRAGSFSTTVSSQFTTGTNVVITVADNTNFLVGAYYHCFDAANGKRCVFKCTNKGTGTITADSIASGPYAAGSYIGVNVMPFVVYDQSYYMQCFAPAIPTASGNIAGISAHVIKTHPFYGNYSSNPFIVRTTDLLGVIVGHRKLYDADVYEIYSQTASAGNYIGRSDLFKCCYSMNSTNNFLSSQAITDLDVQMFGLVESGTFTTGNTLTTLYNTTKSWATNVHAGKAIVITGGTTELGQIGKITANDATSLTVEMLTSIPGVVTYSIVDEAYRTYAADTYGNLLFREGI